MRTLLRLRNISYGGWSRGWIDQVIVSGRVPHSHLSAPLGNLHLQIIFQLLLFLVLIHLRKQIIFVPLVDFEEFRVAENTMLGMASARRHLQFLHRVEVFVERDCFDFFILHVHDQVLYVDRVRHRVFDEDLVSARSRVPRKHEHILVDLLAILIFSARVRGIVEEAEVGPVVVGKHLVDGLSPVEILNIVCILLQHAYAFSRVDLVDQLIQFIICDQLRGHLSDLINEILILFRRLHHELLHGAHLVRLEFGEGTADHGVVVTVAFGFVVVGEVGLINLFQLLRILDFSEKLLHSVPLKIYVEVVVVASNLTISLDIVLPPLSDGGELTH